MPNGFAAEVLQVTTFFLKRVHQSQRAVCGASRNRSHQFFQRIFRHHAQQRAHLVIGNRVAAIRPGLLQKRQRVAQAAFRHARDHRRRARFDLQVFFLRDFFEALRNFRKGQRAKMKVLRARTNRVFQVFRLRRGHHEDYAVRRLFQSFQQSIGSLSRQHVRFVENHHFRPRSRRRVAHHLAQLADLVDAPVRSRIDFNDVKRSSRGNFFARVAHAARFRRRPFHAVQRFRQDSGGGGFSHATCAGKNVRVRHAVVHDGVLQRLGDVLLPDKVLKCLWPVLPGDDLIAHFEVFSSRYSVVSLNPTLGSIKTQSPLRWSLSLKRMTDD